MLVSGLAPRMAGCHAGGMGSFAITLASLACTGRNPCLEDTTQIEVDAETFLGASAEELVASLGHTGAGRWLAGPAAFEDTEVSLAVSVSEGAAVLHETRPNPRWTPRGETGDPGREPECDDYVSAPVDVVLRTSEGLYDERTSAEVELSEGARALEGAFPADGFGGSFSWPASEADRAEEDFSLRVTFDEDGEVQGRVQGDGGVLTWEVLP